KKFDSVRWAQAPEFASYFQDVEKAAAQGWAQDVDQYIRGIATVASPIVDTQGKPRFFIANSSFVGQLDAQKLQALGEAGKQVADAAGAVIFG
ncbi:MAG TPA: hypothetical protein VLJ86_19710, partial [Ramlibacter sp.]|nr:hypothetical protein [Ramlibacter sp.]